MLKMATESRNIKPSGLADFLASRPFSVVHLDAEWNGQRLPVQQRIDLLVEKHEDTSFGYIDVDEHQDYARSINLGNVPTCLYYRGLSLVATVVGMKQDVEGNLQIIRDGGTPDSKNMLSRE